jgi:hypothetical protein
MQGGWRLACGVDKSWVDCEGLGVYISRVMLLLFVGWAYFVGLHVNFGGLWVTRGGKLKPNPAPRNFRSPNQQTRGGPPSPSGPELTGLGSKPAPLPFLTFL